jgi:diguanylate cyclase (GGDEF)-like protein
VPIPSGTVATTGEDGTMRLRGVSAATLLLALCLLPAGMGAAMGQRSQARAALDAGLSHAATEQAEVLSDYFQRARSLTLLAAHNTAFQHFYAIRGTRLAKIRRNSALMGEINEGLGYLETLYPGSIGEACFIDRSGAEVARTVRGVRANVSDLSSDESKNPFFAPTFALPIGSVYQARPYVSPDTEDWVISNSTPLDTPDRSRPAILHFEVTVESFRAAAARAGQYGIDVVDRTTGHVIFDSRYQQVPGAPLGQPADARFASLADVTASSGQLTVEGRPAVYQRLDRDPGNTNDWIVVAVTPAPIGVMYGIGPMSVGLVIAAVLLLVLAGIFDLLARRELVSEAMTDPLTGLGNRRMLMRDLRVQMKSASTQRPLMLILFDLNGFKTYNDAFGHTAGDDLLSRLGRALASAVAARGRAYRLGGDEFCVLATLGQDGVEPTVAAATAALTEHGSAFTIDASYGLILLPSETHDVAEALRLVDQRMYAQKRSGRRSADRQSKDVLLHALYERNPELRSQLQEVGELVGLVAQRMGLSVEDSQRAVQAGELRDVGQVAIPDAILGKNGELDDDERAFVRNEPVIAERIIGAAPALAQVARLVRSSGEHFDGSGHPDGLAGDDIPLGSRIVAACHRYVLLTSGRGRDPQAVSDALDELRRHAGRWLDPQVLSVLSTVVTAPGRTLRTATTG